MVKIVEKYDVAAEIQHSNIRRANKGLSRITIDQLHENQPPALADHLKHDCAHRMLDRFKAAPRNTPHQTKPTVMPDA